MCFLFSLLQLFSSLSSYSLLLFFSQVHLLVSLVRSAEKKSKPKGDVARTRRRNKPFKRNPPPGNKYTSTQSTHERSVKKAIIKPAKIIIINQQRRCNIKKVWRTRRDDGAKKERGGWKKNSIDRKRKRERK